MKLQKKDMSLEQRGKSNTAELRLAFVNAPKQKHIMTKKGEKALSERCKGKKGIQKRRKKGRAVKKKANCACRDSKSRKTKGEKSKDITHLPY
jgi:hypothetical protein